MSKGKTKKIKKKDTNQQVSNEPETQVIDKENPSNENEKVVEMLSESDTQAQLDEARDKYLRLYSEFENFRRRTSKEKLDLISTANKDLISGLIPVLDDFDRATTASASSDDVKVLKDGIALIQNKLGKLLENKGLKKMEVKKSDEFDDAKHEAITQVPSSEDLEGKIVDIIESGYILGESVVRFAKVVVGAKQ